MNSSYEQSISAAYQSIAKSIDVKLNQSGYQIINRKHYDADFGSRYTVWLSNVDAIRLIWDGKASMFVVEVADELPLTNITAWFDVTLVDYDPKIHDDTYLTMVTKEIVDTLD